METFDAAQRSCHFSYFIVSTEGYTFLTGSRRIPWPPGAPYGYEYIR